jgi:NTP pyrophosphatase (non-canonical NTP hydrolase)
MSALTLKEFQQQVSELLLRHRSLLDVLSKSQQSNASINRSIVKAVTECGCIRLNADKQAYSADLSLEEAQKLLKTHVDGKLCDACLEVVTAEVGKNLFYLSSMCNLLGLQMEEIMEKESKKCATLGLFNLS